MKFTQEPFAFAPRSGSTSSRKKSALRPLLVSASIMLAFAASPVGAVDEHHPEAAGATPPTGTSAAQPATPLVEKMQENVREMQSQLERAAAAKTDGERRAALADHMRTMQANMMLARGMMMGEAGALPGADAAMTRPGTMGPEMMGPGMMGPGMMGPGAGPGMMSGMMGSGMMCPGMMAHGMMGRGADGSPESAGLQRMERRLDMMQMMIEQMMRSRQGQATPSQP